MSFTSDLTINSSHIPISAAINNNLTQEPIFLHRQDLEWLIEEFVVDLVKWQEIIFYEVIKMYLIMVDEDSLPSRVQSTWTNWLSQVPIFGFNSGKYNLNMVKYYFVKTIPDSSNVKVAKKDNSYMFLIAPQFKFLDVRNYLAPSLSYDGWCKANGCLIEKLVFLYEWLDDYHTLLHLGPVSYKA